MKSSKSYNKKKAKRQIWYVSTAVDNDVKYSEKKFSKKVHSVLNDTRRGWMSILPITFEFVGEHEKENHPRKIHIRLSKSKLIKKICDIHHMSCCNLETREVWINEDRWFKGSSHSKLSIYDYRVYVINHEVGHALGFLHQDCECYGDGECPLLAPVMMQQTLSIGKCKPNPYPLAQHLKNAKHL